VTAYIYSICTSPERGQLKKEVQSVRIIDNYGIEGDGHAGDWNRQITLLNQASVEKVNREKGLNIGPGEFAENILIKDLDFSSIQVGTRIRLGSDAVVEVSQIGKEDHPSVVTRTLGVSLLPYEGLFCKVVQGGEIHKGDPVEVL
jgi:MOSC domain-containing protein YiiM